MTIDPLPESALVHAEHVRIGSQFDCFCGAGQRAPETKRLLPFEEVARIVAELLGARAAEPVA